jgi:hypothetical protein
VLVDADAFQVSGRWLRVVGYGRDGRRTRHRRYEEKRNDAHPFWGPT